MYDIDGEDIILPSSDCRLPVRFVPSLTEIIQETQNNGNHTIQREGFRITGVRYLSVNITNCDHCNDGTGSVLKIKWCGTPDSRWRTASKICYYCEPCADDLKNTIQTYVDEHTATLLPKML